MRVDHNLRLILCCALFSSVSGHDPASGAVGTKEAKEDDIDALPSKKDLKLIIARGIQEEEEVEVPGVTAAVAVAVALPQLGLHVDIIHIQHQEHLWSDKSRRLFHLLHPTPTPTATSSSSTSSSAPTERQSGVVFDFTSLHKIGE
jgi:hypothetical protein